MTHKEDSPADESGTVVWLDQRRAAAESGPTIIHDCAQIDIEPWPDKGDTLTRTNEALVRCGRPALIAYRIMHMTREELVKMHSELGENLAMQVMEELADCVDSLRDLEKIVDSAHSRFFITACANAVS